MYASSKQGGMCTAIPDTCNTPTPAGTVPTPYPNTVNCPTASSSSCSDKVFICHQKAFHVKTKFNQSNGDQAGAAGGVVSGKIMGEVEYASGSVKVYIQGKPAVYQNCPTKHNGKPPNAVGSQVKPSQTKVQYGA